MKNKKVDINKLKYPTWFKILFYSLTILIPIVFMLIESFTSSSKIFKITITVISLFLLIWIFVRKFIISKIENKLISNKSALEHDYEIKIGDSKAIKWLWFNNELLLSIFNVIEVVLVGGLILLIAIGIETCCIKVKTACLLISILYLIAYIVKFILILSLRGKEENNTEVENGKSTQQSKQN